jgi:hypothetical protein
VTALLALVFVKRHGLRDGSEEKYFLIDSRGGGSIASIQAAETRDLDS